MGQFLLIILLIAVVVLLKRLLDSNQHAARQESVNDSNQVAELLSELRTLVTLRKLVLNQNTESPELAEYNERILSEYTLRIATLRGRLLGLGISAETISSIVE